MLDRTAEQSPDRSPGTLRAREGRERRRALIACAVLALALHAVFLGGVGGVGPDVAPGTVNAPVSVRTLPAEPDVDPTPVDSAAAISLPVQQAVDAPRPRPLRRPRGPAVSASQAALDPAEQASTNSVPSPSSPRPAAEASFVAPVEAPIAAARSPASGASEAGEVPTAVTASAAAGAPGPLLAVGEEPPPVYRTQLPPSVTLHYQVRRGFLRGTGEIRWQASGDRYRLVFEARIAGVALLIQTSEGDIDTNGLAPARFLDQRARRSAQAANFRRDEARITFSGSGVEWPLLAGSQDRLSWMIQLAGIAAAEPERLVDGGRITMVVVGSRGDAGVWTLRDAGREDIAAAGGTVHAVKFVREGRSAYDTSAEIWLDTERSYLPAHATLRNSAGGSEYDLLLERVDPAP
ncbi:MAG: DUF3108 domain-containing protein [Caldimonas sp.]